jgi:hypothetical protein
MDERERLACTHPGKMLSFAQNQFSCRKQRLFVVACCRCIWQLFTDERLRGAVEAGEQFTEGHLDETGLRKAPRIAWEAPSHGANHNCTAAALCCVNPGLTWRTVGLCCAWTARAAAGSQTPHLSPRWRDLVSQEYTAHCALLRHIFGNPFRPVVLNPACRTPTVATLAQAAYENRTLPAGTLEPDRLAVLADALEEAGCTDADILGHLRGPGTHVRGCWPVDAILEQS